MEGKLPKVDSHIRQLHNQLAIIKKQEEALKREFAYYKAEQIYAFCKNHHKFTGSCQELLEHFRNKTPIVVKWGNNLMIFNDFTLQKATVPSYCREYCMEVSDESLMFWEYSAAAAKTSYTFNKINGGFSLSYGSMGRHTLDTQIFITDDYKNLIQDVGYFPTHDFHELVKRDF